MRSRNRGDIRLNEIVENKRFGLDTEPLYRVDG
jgi:hypothetical protein